MKSTGEQDAEMKARIRAEADNAAREQCARVAREDIIAAVGYVRTGIESAHAVRLLQHALDALTPHANPGAALLERMRALEVVLAEVRHVQRAEDPGEDCGQCGPSGYVCVWCHLRAAIAKADALKGGGA